jgi:N-acetyltransferase
MIEHLNLQPILENALVKLQPLAEADFDSLFAVASDPLIWEQHPAKERSEKEGFRKFFEEGLATKAAFLILDKAKGETIGSTRFKAVEESENAVEIGWTFLVKKHWGGVYNQAIKGLMLAHAFQQVGYVLFYIHKDNFRSQKAVKKIGGQQIISLNGTVINTRGGDNLVFGLTKTEWVNHF